MVRTLKASIEVQKGPSVFHCVEAMRNLFDELQTHAKKGPVAQRKAVPTGLFCMSEPVAHADDEEEYDMDNVVDNVLPQKEGIQGYKTDIMQAKGRWPHNFLYEGRCSGRVKIFWTSGATYEGEVLHGNLHGVGTFCGADGSVYKGNWILNKKHGFGRKRYSNGDVYEGTWKWDIPEGQGCYIWSNGSEYYGGWKGGLMAGRGVLSWASGDTYDGQWFDGLADGRGVYTWGDGSTYFGTWRKGLKHGEGRFYPPGSKYVETERLHYACSTYQEEDVVMEKTSVQSPCRQKIYSPSHLPQEVRRLCQEPPFDLALRSLDSDDGVYMDAMEYVNWVLDASDGSISQRSNTSLWDFGGSERSWSPKGRRKYGEAIIEGHRSYELMVNLQLGIRYSVSKVTQERKRKLLLADFSPKSSIRVDFPRDGSQLTPPHQSTDFKWKDYCPMVFRFLRESFKIHAADYMLSICGDAGLRELSSPGKSGSVFYVSQDERFMIKTLRKAEVKVLVKMLPRYYNHVRMYKNTLLTRFFGLHRIKPAGGPKVRFIVMGNVVATNACIHRLFDLKGSSQGRCADKKDVDASTTLKDLDLDMEFRLDPLQRDAVLEQISHDCQFLENEHIMDYSLLLGIHFNRLPSATSVSSIDDFGSGLLLHASSQHERYDVRLGSSMPAQACRVLGTGFNDPDLSQESCGVTLYFGIIDILQEYDVGKKLEHAYKSLHFDSLSISAVEPALYSKRFQHFIRGIFPAVS